MDPTLQQIHDEAQRASSKYGMPTSAHESLGVLIEEVDELRHAIHMNKAGSIKMEAIQVAAVAYRLALACAGGDPAFYKRSGLRHD